MRGRDALEEGKSRDVDESHLPGQSFASLSSSTASTS